MSLLGVEDGLAATQRDSYPTLEAQLQTVTTEVGNVERKASSGTSGHSEADASSACELSLCEDNGHVRTAWQTGRRKGFVDESSAGLDHAEQQTGRWRQVVGLTHWP